MKPLKQIRDELIEGPKWTDLLQRFVEVLKINLFVIDSEGRILIPLRTERGKGNRCYGSAFLFSSALGFTVREERTNILERFSKKGMYLEYLDPFQLMTSAIPITIEENKNIGYLIVGPVILNKRLDPEEYHQIAKKIQFENEDEVTVMVNEIRVVSFVTMKSILDLLAEIVKDMVELNLERNKLDQMRFKKEILSKDLSSMAKDIYASIHLNELLATLLDVALDMTKTEAGSIMLFDEKNENLTIKVSRGLDEVNIRNTSLRRGEGIAGLAAQENASFIIEGNQGENRIQHLLKRPQIKKSLIMPLQSSSGVFGVMNLSTKTEGHRIDENIENLQYLSKLISTVFTNI